MDDRPKILDILASAEAPAADQTLVAGLLLVERARQLDIVDILLMRNQDAGLYALPGVYHQLEERVQSRIVSNSAKLFGALRASIRQSNQTTRANTIEIIRRSGNLRLAYLCAIAMRDSSPRIRNEAALALLELTERHCRSHEETTALLRDVYEPNAALTRAVVQTLTLLREERQFLSAALRDALDCYESHHRTEVVQAAMYLAEELEDELFQGSSQRRGKLTHAMLELFIGSLLPRLAPFAYIALRYRELRARVVSVIAACQDPAFFDAFIRHYWLARDPNIRKHLQSIRMVAWLGDGSKAAFTLRPGAAKATPSWLLPLGLPPEAKVAVLRHFLLLDNVDASREAVWALIQINTASSTKALETVLDHEDPALARIAKHELAQRRRDHARLVRRPAAGRPEAWAKLLNDAHLLEDFESFWSHFDRIDPSLAKSAGNHVLNYVPGFLTQVRVKLLGREPHARLQALRLVVAVRVAEHFRDEILRTAHDASQDVRAAAMVALGHIGDATCRRIIERALNDESSLVQEQAILGLDAMDAPGRAEQLIPKTASEDASVRAAAIRVLLRMRVGEGAVGLIYMLNDPRSDHRLTALWVADQLQLSILSPRVADLVSNDKDPRVVRVAQHVLKRLRRLQPAIETDEARTLGAAIQ